MLNVLIQKKAALTRTARLALIGEGFRAQTLAYFNGDRMKGQKQRIDGIECFSPMGDSLFLNFRLSLMAKIGDLETFRKDGFWASTRNMPYYGLAKG